MAYWTTKYIEQAQGPVDFAALTGIYRWVWNGENEAEEHEIRPTSNAKHTENYLELSLVGDSESPLDNVHGFFMYGELEGTFTGIKPAVEGDSKKVIPGLWNINRVKWKENWSEMLETWQAIWVSEQLDDNGNPFIGLRLSAGPQDDEQPEEEDAIPSVEETWEIVGKKQKEGHVPKVGKHWEGLSQQEKKRLKLREEDYGDEQSGEEESGEENNEVDSKLPKKSWKGITRKPFLVEDSDSGDDEDDIESVNHTSTSLKRKASPSKDTEAPKVVKQKRS